MPSDDLRYPTIEGAIEVVKHLGVEPQSIDFDCQDWKYTFPSLLQLPEYLRVYADCKISDKAKRVLGCFIFQAMDDHLRMNGSESLVRNTLEALKQDYHIHEPEFRYWALVDLSEEERGEPDDDFYVTRFAAEYIK